ncbi:MAG: VapE domain-containing protein, partial [Myxococcota bacterium]
MAFGQQVADANPQMEELSWCQLLRRHRKQAQHPGRKKDSTYVFPGILGDLLNAEGNTRHNENVVSHTALAADLDDVTPSQLDDIFSGLDARGVAYWAWSTWRSTPAAPRWRIIVPLAEPAEGEQRILRVWNAANKTLWRGLCDASMHRLAQVSYEPARPDGPCEWREAQHPTKLLDAGALLRASSDDAAPRPQVVPGVVPEGQRNNHLYAMGCSLRGDGATFTEIREALHERNRTRCSPPLPDKEVDGIARSTVKFQRGLRPEQRAERAEKAAQKAAQKETKLKGISTMDLSKLLEDAGGLAYDEYLVRVRVVGPAPWQVEPFTRPRDLHPSDVHDVMCWCNRLGYRSPSRAEVGATMDRVAYGRRTDSLQTYLRGLSWDGVPRLDGWLTRYLGVDDTDYSRVVGRKWMLQAAHRGMHPGAKADYTLVLEGRGGVGKTRACQILGGAFYRAGIPSNVGDKDAALAMGGSWIIELGELTQLRGSRSEALKEFLTRDVDTFRPPYAQHTISVPRRAVFVATTNEGKSTGYLYADPGGHRRFWPVEVTSVDTDALQADVHQLWAEAVASLALGESPYPDRNVERDTIIPEQEDRVSEDPWFPRVQEYVAKQGDRVTVADVLARGIGKHIV